MKAIEICSGLCPKYRRYFSFVYRVNFLWEGTEWGEGGERGTGRDGRERGRERIGKVGEGRISRRSRIAVCKLGLEKKF